MNELGFFLWILRQQSEEKIALSIKHYESGLKIYSLMIYDYIITRICFIHSSDAWHLIGRKCFVGWELCHFYENWTIFHTKNWFELECFLIFLFVSKTWFVSILSPRNLHNFINISCMCNQFLIEKKKFVLKEMFRFWLSQQSSTL